MALETLNSPIILQDWVFVKVAHPCTSVAGQDLTMMQDISHTPNKLYQNTFLEYFRYSIGIYVLQWERVPLSKQTF
jgi:hypothetical protein